MPRITITVSDKTPQPYRFQLDRQTVTLGRGSENDIAIDCRSVSVKHAEMRRVEGGYELRDLGSTNGIKLNGERQEVIELRDGIAATLGDVTFDFVLTDEERELLSREKPESSIPEGDKIDDAVELPAEKPAPTPKKAKIAVEHDGGGGFLMVLLFLILAASAFFAGMAVRHQKDTGSSLIDAIRIKVKMLNAPAASKVPVVPQAPPASDPAEIK